MDVDMSQSDMSRLTTMLAKAGAPFVRSYGPLGSRIIEIGNVEFHFEPDGGLAVVVITDGGTRRAHDSTAKAP